MRASALLAFSLCFTFTASPVLGQSSESVGGVRAHIEGIEIPPVANAPFTAKVVVTWREPLVGGGTSSRTYYTQIARDSQGRVRRETRGFVPVSSGAEPPLRTFSILDPVSKTRTVCTTATMNCATSPFQPRLNLATDGGTLSGSGSNASQESLGQQTMLNLPVRGTRETVSGLATGNRLAITQIVSWYSPDLHINLSVDRSNQEMGEVTLKVTQLVQGEPDPSLLTVPADYRTIDDRSH